MDAPQKINLKDDNTLRIVWNEDIIHFIPLKYLRDEAPDAGNKGETILWKHYEAPPKGPDLPGKYEINQIKLTGNYGINIYWKDGNSDSIYSWDLLFEMGERIEITAKLPSECHKNKKEG